MAKLPVILGNLDVTIDNVAPDLNSECSGFCRLKNHKEEERHIDPALMVHGVCIKIFCLLLLSLSLSPSLCLPLPLSLCFSLPLSICLSLRLSVSLYPPLSVALSLCLSLCVSLCVSLSVSLSLSLSLCLSLPSLSVSLSLGLRLRYLVLHSREVV